MKLTSKTLGAEYTVNELTQGMAETILERLEVLKDLVGVPFETSYLDLARDVGWIELYHPAKELPRRHAVWLSRKLFDIWEEANTLPND